MRSRPHRFIALLVVIALMSTGPVAFADESTVTQEPAYIHAELWTDSTSFRFYASIPCHYPTQMLGRDWSSLNEMERAVTQYLWGRGYLTTDIDPATMETGLFEIVAGYESEFNPAISYIVSTSNNCVRVFYSTFGEDCVAAELALEPFDNPIRGTPVVRDANNLNQIWGWYGSNSWYGKRCLEVVKYNAFFAYVEDQIGLVEPAVPLSPDFGGLAGLDTWAWYEITDATRDPFVDGFDLTIPTTGNPLDADVTVWLTEIRWDFDGDGGWDFVETCGPSDPTSVGDVAPVIDCGGTPDAPVVDDFVYETSQDYDIVSELQWVGWFDLPAMGIRLYLETTLLISSTTRTYTVHEIRPVIVPADD